MSQSSKIEHEQFFLFLKIALFSNGLLGSKLIVRVRKREIVSYEIAVIFFKG